MNKRLMQNIKGYFTKKSKLKDFDEPISIKRDYKKIISFIILMIVIISEIIYYSYKFYKIKSNRQEIEVLIVGDKAYLDQLKNTNQSAEKLSSSEKQKIENEHANKEYIIGANVKNVEIVEKITKSPSNTRYFKVKLYYTAENIDAVKDLIILKYINPNVYKITDVTKDYIELILKED